MNYNEDYSCAEYLRKYKKVVLLANKSELKNSKKYKNQGFVLGCVLMRLLLKVKDV